MAVDVPASPPAVVGRGGVGGEPIAGCEPVAAHHFSAAMDAFGPFEAAPHLAVAVSGGSDSLALVLLADRWVRSRDGRVTALTVDHRLRPEARREALWVKRVLHAAGVDHRILTWEAGAELSRANLQARAREARYELLQEWCRRRGVLHLLTAHQLEDQAETFLMRAARGSGLYGLAAMPAISELSRVRLLRPLLAVGRRDLRAFLEGLGQEWLDDPSNEDEAFTRARIRGVMPALEEVGLTPRRMAEAAVRLGRDRAQIECAAARLLARVAAPDPAGFVRIDGDALAAAPTALGLRALSRVLVAVGGGTYPPRSVRLRRLYDEVLGRGRGRTLAGCTIRRAGGGILVCREPAAQAAPLQVRGPGTVRWDGRFLIRLSFSRGAGGRTGLTVGALGRDGWARISRDGDGYAGDGPSRRLPGIVRETLPALRDRDRILAVPHLGYRRPWPAAGNLVNLEIRPFSVQPLAGPQFGTPAR